MKRELEHYPVLPIRKTVLFPGCVETVQINRPNSLNLLLDLEQNKREIVLLPFCEETGKIPDENNFCEIGVLAKPIVIQKSSDKSSSVTFEAIRRLQFSKLVLQEPYFIAEFSELPECTDADAYQQISEKIYNYALVILESAQHYSPEVAQIFHANRNDIPRLVDMVAHHIHLPFKEKRKLLAAKSLKERVLLLFDLIGEERQRIDLEKELKSKVDASIDETHRELYLRAKLKEIKKELGEGSDDDLSLYFRRRAEMIENLPLAVNEQLFIETERLKVLSPASTEFGIIKTYLDWLLAIPWSLANFKDVDLNHVENVIDDGFYGSKQIKDRVIEYLAIKQIAENSSSPVLCLSGPQGTGKASLAHSIARSLGKKVKRLSVAGLLSDIDVTGEPRSVVGSIPGLIIRSLIDVNCLDPVIFIEDLDKLCSDETRLSAALALLGVIDPRRNRRYIDEYIGLPIDLSRTIFIFSTRENELIPEALIDRMEIINFPGYIESEKILIAEKYMIPDLLKKCKIKSDELIFSTGAIRTLIQNYTMEAGLGQMKHRIETICRKYSRARATSKQLIKWMITEDNVEEYFGTAIFVPEKASTSPEIGVAAGVAWTCAGGDIMMIEGLKMRGDGIVTCTGSLGEIIRESVQAAHSFVRSKADLLGIRHEDFAHFDIHIHFPQGAVPKDGPSAGLTISLVIASVMSDRAIRNDVAITGEVSLRGKVLAVSGIKEKVAAAHRTGIFKFILPKQNEKDIKDLTPELKDEMEFIFVERTEEIFEQALLEYEPGMETLEDMIRLELLEQENKQKSKQKKVAKGKTKTRKSKTKKQKKNK